MLSILWGTLAGDLKSIFTFIAFPIIIFFQNSCRLLNSKFSKLFYILKYIMYFRHKSYERVLLLLLWNLIYSLIVFPFFLPFLFSNLTFAGRWFFALILADWLGFSWWGGEGRQGGGWTGLRWLSGPVLLMTWWRVFMALNNFVCLGFVICTLAFLCNFTYGSWFFFFTCNFSFCQFAYFVCKLPAIRCQSQHALHSPNCIIV